MDSEDRSCESQLLLCVDDIVKSLDKGEQIDIILLYLQKAFDNVPYQRLLQKLYFCAVKGQLNEWICSFLSDCTQAVVLNGSRSDEINVASGVPQGSILGPILFAIFINDLPKDVKSHVRLFADDCIVYWSIKNQEDASILQEDISSLQKWADE